MSITTKTGDRGMTALMYGRKVPKSDIRVAAYGAVDELTSAMGMARTATQDTWIGEKAFQIQKELITVMGELATANEDRERYAKAGFHFTTAEMTDRLHAVIMDLEKNHKIRLKDWAIPGANPSAAAWDMARTVCRRAERQVILAEEMFGEANPEIRRYLNRLSDLCWLFARYLEHER